MLRPCRTNVQTRSTTELIRPELVVVNLLPGERGQTWDADLTESRLAHTASKARRAFRRIASGRREVQRLVHLRSSIVSSK